MTRHRKSRVEAPPFQTREEEELCCRLTKPGQGARNLVLGERRQQISFNYEGVTRR